MKVNKVHAAVVAALTGVTWSDVSDRVRPRRCSRKSSSRRRAVSRISKRYPSRSSRSRAKTSRCAASTTSRKSAKASRTSHHGRRRRHGRHELPHARHPERRHLHRRRLAGRHGRLPDARVRRDRPRRSVARPARHDVRPRLHGRRDPHLDEAPGRRVRRQHLRATAGSNDRCDVKASLDLPLGDNVRTKWTAASLSRDGYITARRPARTAAASTRQCSAATSFGTRPTTSTSASTTRTTRASSPSRACRTRCSARSTTRHRTGSSQHHRPAGAVHLRRHRLSAAARSSRSSSRPTRSPAIPGGRVGEWENRSGTTLPNHYDTEQLSLETNWQLSDNMSLQFLTATDEQDADSVVDWDNSQYDLVLDMNRSELDVFSQEIQLTGGSDRIEWLGGRLLLGSGDPHAQRPLAGQRVPARLDEPEQRVQPARSVTRPARHSSRLRRRPTTRPTCASSTGTFGTVQTGLYAGQNVQLGGDS